MTRRFIFRLLLSSWKVHSICCITVILCSIPLLWPPTLPEYLAWVTDGLYGNLITLAFTISALLGSFTVLYSLFRLRYTRSLLNLLAWFVLWGATAAVWIFMALSADVAPLPAPRDSSPIQQTNDLYNPNDELKGPSSLVKKLVLPEEENTAQLAYTPNMLKLETEHRGIFETYLNSVPRWAYHSKSSAFYAEPGHMIFSLPVRRQNLKLVHVCFRYIEDGTELPEGFVVVKPGEPMPEPSTEGAPMPDLAVNLGSKHFLLIACRGMQSVEETRRVINATLRTIDARLQKLADKPIQATVDAAVQGVRSFSGTTPELLLCEPPTQSGTYQAEVYCNPREDGEIMMIITHMDTGKVLRLFSCPARHSSDENQLFRHDFPGDIATAGSNLKHLNKDGLLPNNVPLFTIMEGEAHRFSPVVVEVWFTPRNQQSERKLILRRCYKVQSYAVPGQPRTKQQTAPPATQRDTPEAGIPKTNIEPTPATAPEQPIAEPAPAITPEPSANPTPAATPEQPAIEPTSTVTPVAPAEPTPSPTPEATSEPVPAATPEAPAEPTPAASATPPEPPAGTTSSPESPSTAPNTQPDSTAATSPEPNTATSET